MRFLIANLLRRAHTEELCGIGVDTFMNVKQGSTSRRACLCSQGHDVQTHTVALLGVKALQVAENAACIQAADNSIVFVDNAVARGTAAS